MCNNQSNQHRMDSFHDLFTVCCGIPSVLLNILVLYIALRYVDFHVKLTQIYVVNMTVSDLLYGLVYMTTKPLVACFPGWLCAIYYILIWSSQIGSVFFLLFLNIDKFISLSAPLHYNIYVTERRVWCLWITFWLIPLSHSLSAYFGPLMSVPFPDIPCAIRLDPIYYASTVIVFYIVPLTISAMISVYIYVLAHKKSWAIQSGSEERKKKHLKRVFFVFSSTLWSTLTILPYRLAYCIWTFACLTPQYSSAVQSIPMNITLSTDQSLEDTTFSTSTFPTTLGLTMVNSSTERSQTAAGAGGGLSAMCESDQISVLIYVLFCLPPLGAVGNPIITIVTQRFYRLRAVQMWRCCVKSLMPCLRNGMPECLLLKCCGNGLGENGEVTTMSCDSKMSVDIRKSTSKVNVPLLVTLKESGSRKDIVVEAVTSNKAFQVL